ncbi:MAG TPA: class I SAM-dependent methyltransferase [Candidatus Dormibacteraeota bacterium]|nr:class I SAM-dependent methyltransferase [Candidatus Dormibacteraeota bacterium]
MRLNPLTVIQSAVEKHLPELGLPSGARILDAPCGGLASLTLALRERGFDAIGADIDFEAATHLRAAFQKVNLDAKLPWTDESFDAVISTEGIEHLENHFSFLREANRILKSGGVFVLTTPNITALRSRVRFFGSGFFGRDTRPLNESARHPLHHIGLATFSELRYELHVSGFQISKVRHTHIKPISYLYAIYAPWIWLYTRLAFRKEKDPAQSERNKEILRTLLSHSVLFGECLMLVARKVSALPSSK